MTDMDECKDTAVAMSANRVLVDTRNKAPVFPDQDMEIGGPRRRLRTG